jgi:hypothetical protein
VPELDFLGSGTAKIIWDSVKWLALDQFQTGLPYKHLGITRHRPITMLKLQSIKTGEFAWFVDTHLVVNIPKRSGAPRTTDKASDHLDRAAA